MREELDDNYATKLKALEKRYTNDRKTLQERVSKLTRDNKVAQFMIDKLAKQLAEKDKNEVSGLYKKALELVRRGELEKACKVLDDSIMDVKVRRVKKESRDLADSYILKAQIASVRLEFSNADNYYRLAVDVERGYYLSTALYAVFLYSQKQFEEALEIREKLAEQNPGAYELDLADTLLSIVFASHLNSENATNQQYKAKMEKMRIRVISILKKYPHVPSAKAKLKWLIELTQQGKSVQKK